MYGSTDRSSSSITMKKKQNSINTTKQLSNGLPMTNKTSIQEENQAKQRTRNQGYIVPRKVTRRTNTLSDEFMSTNKIMNLFYNSSDIYNVNVENMDLLGTIYYLLPERVYGSQYENSITYLPFVDVNTPYCGCGPVVTTDSTYTIVNPNNFIWFDAIRSPSKTNDWKDIPALYYETANYTSNEGNFYAKSIYFDAGITSTTESPQEDFYVDYSNGIYSGAKVVRFLYDNANYTREVQIYGYVNV